MVGMFLQQPAVSMNVLASMLSLPAWRWLHETQQAVAHSVFAQACNLRNEQGDWLSLVLPASGIGPFTVVVLLPEGCGFHDWLSPGMPASVTPRAITLPSLTIHLTGAALWEPCPDWSGAASTPLAPALAPLITWLPLFSLAQSPYAAAAQTAQATLQTGLRQADLAACCDGAKQLGGMGPGLTPAGDDFLLGVMAALWLIWSAPQARLFSQTIAAAAEPRTTSLSAAWLAAAAMGNVSIYWHQLLRALSPVQIEALQAAVDAMLSVGASSGADALAGFVWASQILVQ